MRTEVPVLKRCCCCLPLRRGLLAWGYLKLMITSVLLILIIATLITVIINRWMMYINEHIFIAAIIFLALDVIANIIFIIGAHKKSLKLLKAYYFYSIFFLALTSLASILFAINEFYTNWDYISNSELGSGTAVLLLILLMQIYILILQRSQIVKMSDSPSYRFVNNAAEAESSLAIEYPHEEKDSN